MRDDIQQLLEQFKQSQERSAQSPAGFTEEEVNELQGQPAPPMQAPEVDETPLSALRPPEGATPQGPRPMNAELEAALQRRADMEQKAAMLRGFQTMVKGATGFDADMTMADQLAKRGQREVDEYQAGQKAQREAEKQKQADELGKIKIGKAEFEFTNIKKTSDPTSPESKLAQDMFIQHAQESGTQIDEQAIRQVAAKDLHANSKFLQDKLANMMKEKLASQRIAATDERSEKRMAHERKMFDESQARLKDTSEKNRDIRERKENRQAEKKAEDLEKTFRNEARNAKNDLKKDPRWQSAVKAANAIEEMGPLLEDAYRKGGQSLAMLGPRIAKGIAGEVGVLTERDVVRYVQNPTLVGGVMDSIAKVTKGKITDVSYENLKRLLGIVEEESKRRIEEAINDEAILFSRRNKLPVEEARSYIDSEFVNKPDKKEAKESEGEIKRRTKDGRTAVFDANKKFLRYED